MEPHIHDGVQLTEYNSDFLSCSLQKQSADRQREEKESRSFIAVVVILQVCAVLFPIGNREAENFLFLVQDLKGKESMILEVLHQLKRLSLGVDSKDSGQCPELADPLTRCLHISIAVDHALIGAKVCVAEERHETEQMDGTFVAELLVIIEVPKPRLINSYLRKAHQLLLLCAAHLIHLLPDRVINKVDSKSPGQGDTGISASAHACGCVVPRFEA